VGAVVVTGVAVSESLNRRTRILELLYDHTPENAGELPAIVDLLGETPDSNTEDLLRGSLRALRGDGLIVLAETMGFEGTSAYLTDTGRVEVEAMRARRNDPAQRRAAAARGVLRFLYDRDQDGTGWTEVYEILYDDHSVFEGIPLPDQVIRRAVEQLVSDGLIEPGSSAAELGPVTARLTREGQECVESGANVT
jgi:hypothetical protein